MVLCFAALKRQLCSSVSARLCGRTFHCHWLRALARFIERNVNKLRKKTKQMATAEPSGPERIPFAIYSRSMIDGEKVCSETMLKLNAKIRPYGGSICSRTPSLI